MYAVVNIAGKQVKVERGQRLKVPRLQAAEGSRQEFKDVLLVSTEDQTLVGTPAVEGVAVAATVLGHGRGDKVIVFKMKRRKNYRRRNGHRQDYTQIQIDDIVLPN